MIPAAAIGGRYLKFNAGGYNPLDQEFDEQVTAAKLLALWLRTCVSTFLIWIPLLVVTGILAYLGAYQIFLLALFAGPVIYLVLLLTLTTNDPISESTSLIPDAGEAADGSFAAIGWSLRSRRVPVTAQPKMIRSDIILPGSVSRRLEIRDGSYYAYVNVFAYGTSLYVGWSMWRRRPGRVLIFTYWRDLFANVVNRADVMARALRTDKARAMREALDIAMREGIEAAIEGTELTTAQVYGGLAVENVDITSAEGAVAPPPAPLPDFGQAPALTPSADFAPA
ncbi:hypothetical protein KDL01_13170, partial [Actinospica durhamensis]